MTDGESIHPSIWRASQLGRTEVRCIDTGHMALSNQLPGGGWPVGAVIELLGQPGIGEMQVLGPALAAVAHKQVVLIAPPQVPNIIAFNGLGVPPSSVIWIKAKSHADVLWSADQVARSGACGAVLLWAQHIRTESIRKLNLAALTGDTLLFLMRPPHAAQDASPAALRLSMRAAAGGIDIGFVKRRGPARDEPLFLPLPGPLTHKPAPARRPASVPTATPAPAGAGQLVE